MWEALNSANPQNKNENNILFVFLLALALVAHSLVIYSGPQILSLMCFPISFLRTKKRNLLNQKSNLELQISEVFMDLSEIIERHRESNPSYTITIPQKVMDVVRRILNLQNNVVSFPNNTSVTSNSEPANTGPIVTTNTEKQNGENEESNDWNYQNKF